MNKNLFKLFDKLKKKNSVIGEPTLCDHLDVSKGVCNQCFEILWTETVYEDYYNHTIQRNVYTIKVDNFCRDYCDNADVCEDYEKFIIAYDGGLKKNRKNFLLNKWVSFQLITRRGYSAKRYKIKNLKSRTDHEELCQKVFDFYGWGLISL